MSNFYERLKETRKTLNLTQKQVAEGIDISERLYQKYEYGNTKPNFEYIIKLCNYFNVSADYLLGLSDDPTRH